ncbi:tetratricopeptide repeat protein [Treponema denticola]|uniref:Tetratricopeptide repeat protein n=1 Tax=Treponema denticola TaxID=158 RepID=A0A9Q9BKY6_TREDN|nr:tetratricopeptide repeat protein [Treponema denticola]UTC90199.1 tetratricopeptide repeat protein [Treponema denticola]UTD00450.1 tetratricopeptide repeat protein [Treponema denticola]
MKKSIVLFFILLVSFRIFADYKSEYDNLLSARNLEGIAALLPKWEKAEPKNPELYIAYFNYYLLKGQRSTHSLDTYKKDNTNSLALVDKKTNKIAGYLNNNIWYEKEDVDKALSYLEKGLKFGKSRLDMYFGRIHILGEIGEYEKQSQKIIEVLKLGKEINHKWLWSMNEVIPASESERIFLVSINDYYKALIQKSSPQTLSAAEKTCEAQLKLYPKNIEVHNYLALAYIGQGKIQEALNVLLKADKLAKEDYTILFNMASCYETLKQYDKAKECYLRIKKNPDKQVQDMADQKLSELKKLTK